MLGGGGGGGCAEGEGEGGGGRGLPVMNILTFGHYTGYTSKHPVDRGSGYCGLSVVLADLRVSARATGSLLWETRERRRTSSSRLVTLPR